MPSAVLVVILLGSVVAVATTRPPSLMTETNGLSEDEVATLWSRDDESGYISNAAYRERYGEPRSALQQLANASDITFQQPPDTAARWTRSDHTDLKPTGDDVSLYPRHAERIDGTYVRDAHATIFATTPSTVVHSTPAQTTRYLAPDGTLRGWIDYRVTVPETNSSGNRTTDYSLVASRISEVRLENGDGRTLARTTDTSRPVLDYQLSPSTRTLRLVAEIHVEIEVNRTQTTSRPILLPNGTVVNTNDTASQTEILTETITVSDQRSVEPYTPAIELARAETPDGEHIVAAFAAEPWQGLRFGERGDRRIRGVWRYYTARDVRWDTLVRSDSEETAEEASPALPVEVHAYPSELGPRSDPVGRLPTLIEVWGRDRRSPAGTLPETVSVDVVEQEYTASYGVAVRTNESDSESVSAAGIVRGVEVPIERTGGVRQLRESELTVTVIDRTAENATVRIKLTDAETGAPIVLGEQTSPFPEPPGGVRTGYIDIAGNRVQTNRTGVAIVTVSEPGVYTARYVPGSWLSHSPAYTSASATARWHPLMTMKGWLRLLVTALQWFLPFAVAVYAGGRLGRLFRVGGVHR